MELRMNGYTPNNALFDALWSGLDRSMPHSEKPAADVVEDGEAYRFYFEIPGLKADSLDVKVEDGTLKVQAERKRPEWAKDAKFHVSERSYGTIRRGFELPDDAAHDGTSASYRDGVLEIRVPKRPESKPVKIKVELN